MGFWDAHILPRIIDCGCSTKPALRERKYLMPAAHGEVLEIGFGSGLNMSYYDPSKITTLWGLEPSEELRQRAQPRIDATPIRFEFLGLNGEAIPADNAQFDTVVTTFTLCTITNVTKALGEMRRVLKPGGSLLFAEHGVAPDADVRKWQDRLNPTWGKLFGGCHLNRDIVGLVTDAGFVPDVQEAGYRRGMLRFMGYMTRGIAKPVA